MKIVNGWHVPSHDVSCHPVIFEQSNDIPEVLKFVKGREVCVQAGGNLGVWPKALAKEFRTVYTFEPDPENFNCLGLNVPEHNVIKIQGALGKEHKMIAVGPTADHERQNCGAYQVTGVGTVPMFLIDDLELPACDLIYLDIEGFEYFAFQGAHKTLDKYRPVLAFEDKILTENYGIEVGDVEKYLERYGYEVVLRIHRDVVCAVR